MAEGTIEAQEKILLDSKNTLVKQLGEMMKNSDLDLKDRKSARQQRDKLIKGNNTLGSDLKKNVQDLKDGITTTVDGFINESILFLMYSNLGTKKIKHNNVINDAPKKVKKTNRLTPDIKIKDSQDKKTNKV